MPTGEAFSPSIRFSLPKRILQKSSAAKLTHTPKEILTALIEAKTPYNAGPDSDLQLVYNENARQAYKELVEKQAFVEEYFSKEN